MIETCNNYMSKGGVCVGKVNILDTSVSNLIAAGEVVERPASVIKELVENSVDAKADVITVEIRNGGVAYMRITDNGTGMEPDDVGIAFLRHATSKISTAEDLAAISTLGFRGEALSSVAAVSKLSITTKTKDAEVATRVHIEGGEMEDVSEAGAPNGTTIEIRELFFNTPARMKFLKKDSTEAGYIADIMEKFIMAYPDISFRLINNGKQQLFSAGDNNLQNAIYTIYGKDYANSIIPIKYGDDMVSITGYIGRSNISRPNRSYQSFFVNNRSIQNRTMTAALEEGYKNQLMGGKFPFAVLKLEVNPTFVDVNVHPNKKEVKFSDEKKVFDTVYWAVKNALHEKPAYPEISLPTPKQTHKIDNTEIAPSKPTEKVQDSQIKMETVAAPYAEEISVSPTSSRLREDEENSYISDVNTPNAVKPKDLTVKCEAESLPLEPQTITQYITEVMHAQISQNNTAIDNEKSKFQDYKIIGQVFSTYIILECGDEIMLIDQHAAHERIIFERLLKDFTAGNAIPQTLLIPITVKLTHSEFELAVSNTDFFQKIGFEIEEFGNNTIVIRMVPQDLLQDDIKDLFIELLEGLANSRNDMMGKTKERAIFTIACKAAIKANHSMKESEIHALIENISELEGINTCPHGRPITISLTKKEIEKQFKRIV